MGSYLRGKKDCGDIDYLIYKMELVEQDEINKILFELVLFLKRKHYIECDLTEITPTMDKFMGGAIAPNYSKNRRVDIISVAYSNLGASLLYFAGNGYFNRCLRLLAGKKGLHLNERGLYKDKSNTKLIESFSEKKILDILGVGWVEYKDRDI
ncbi:unnamed protein product [Ambrosiozyma monospora]|uniref:Unnamed protein product n=1 Tax=Ambrosiozyma monospora TaxID=43982 RepID=A0A9W7DDC8_AMBMO|nr:unnamed protein product [Ambrosiozyma monospora]